ncbi:MAG TPA: phosphoribosyltransferase [Holophagaceae bacterium]|nr:phosphoribosyltransferase [Holophagaceae bacterium]
MNGRFLDRTDAGQRLGKALAKYAGRKDVLVLGLPRGGVPVACQVARALKAPVDACIVRKLGTPGQEELAMGAIASGGIRVLNEDVIASLDIPPSTITAVEARERRELERRERDYREGRPAPVIKDRTVILVDDGVATGATMFAAIQALRQGGPRSLVVAVPVAPPSTVEELERKADEVVCLLAPEYFFAIGAWYDDFGQTSDEEVRDCLHHQARPVSPT